MSEPKRDRERLPPGQVRTLKWPVLNHGPVPQISLDDWRFRVEGLVESPATWTWSEFTSLPQSEVACDIHCVTRWSRFDNRFGGVPTRVVLERVKPTGEAAFVLVHAVGEFVSNIPMADFAVSDAIFAMTHDGTPLAPEHGWPLRLVVPHLYFWKSVKWVTGLEFVASDAPGFWEQRGYHRRGDPWHEERFDDD
ncbi:MAG: sulfite oxidase-like oxidoreductase [Planctomycetes bacterium]|nr:sulfite oxidase-like oxidoreductase [Planctomycetota bacterium]MBI3844212.1 sulfite oxidase-like oxidoreductase [Planctomycetota bacterium]